ncbi:MAG: hypothetical protein M1819_000392 [Sarea resinae]|nr:MAG: hypothetical protein M1819_000392 [Sarea resinae]
MLYELIAVVRPGNVSEVREIARTTGSLILQQGGVIRGLTNWGPFTLPKPTRKHQATHHRGHYFLMRFDAQSNAQHLLKKTLNLDPRMIRFNVVKMGETLKEIAEVEGKAPWGRRDDDGVDAEFGGRSRASFGDDI